MSLAARLVLVAVLGVTADGASAADKIPLADAVANAVRQSKITLQGSKPFHLRARIVETTNPSSAYEATVEEVWVSPETWMRTIESPGFSQKLIVDRGEVSEKDTGDYFPWWLNDLLTAMLDPLPMQKVLANAKLEIMAPHGGAQSSSCADLRTDEGRWVICFEGSRGLLASVHTAGYQAEFKDFAGFGDKQVARRIIIYPESGTTIEASVTELTEIQPDSKMFVIDAPTPAEEQIRSVRLTEGTLRSLVRGTTEIQWPLVGGGLLSGGCAVYVSADRAGNMREVWPGGCDNAGLQDPLRDAVKKWKLKPAVAAGIPVQVEARVTFTFHTAVAPGGDPTPLLSDEQVRQLATNIVEPRFPPGAAERGTKVVLRISVDESGKIAGVSNPYKLKNELFFPALNAIRGWHFRPYPKDGKPQYFHAEVTFVVR